VFTDIERNEIKSYKQLSLKVTVDDKKIRIADPNQALYIWFYQRGGTPPIGFSSITTVARDKDLVNPSRILLVVGEIWNI
jgi:prolyl-tRNA editing enzyme YbaK/EbsC (Cys-tRNA(Pro) deacylase)